MHHGPLVKWLRQRPLTPLTSVRIRYGSPDFSRAKVLDKGSEIQYNTVCSPARPDDIELVLIRARVHPFPFRTRQLSSFLLTILGWRRPGKIGSANTERPHRLMWPFFVAWEASFCNIIKWSIVCNGFVRIYGTEHFKIVLGSDFVFICERSGK